jgi:hypothetical protein
VSMIAMPPPFFTSAASAAKSHEFKINIIIAIVRPRARQQTLFCMGENLTGTDGFKMTRSWAAPTKPF